MPRQSDLKYSGGEMNDYSVLLLFDEEVFSQGISRTLASYAPVRAEAAAGGSVTPETHNSSLNNHTSMSPANEKLYDLSMVHSVSGGDEGFIKKMVALFIETVPQNLQELSNATDAENWDQVGKTAHKLKSTVDSMGIKSIRQEIRTVEANAKQRQSLQRSPRWWRR